MNYYEVNNGTLYLSHYGIVGQKWGVRRFQNKDGGLTKLGRIRYGNQNGSMTVTKTTDKDGNTIYSVRKKNLGKMTPEEIAERARQEKAVREYKEEKKAYKDKQRQQREDYKRAKQDAKYDAKLQKLNYEKELERMKTQKKLNAAQVKNQQATADLVVKKDEQSRFWGGAKKMVGDAIIESGKEVLKAGMVAGGKYAVGKMLSKATKNDYFFNAITNQKGGQQNKKDGDS